ncbi:MAG: hypothetical protein ACREBD_25345 [Blastocatellia bacterium]
MAVEFSSVYLPANRISDRRRAILRLSLLIFCFLIATSPVLAQREYTVIKPRPRPVLEPVTVPRRASQPTKVVLAVFLDPIVAGKVVVTDTKGRVLEEADADSEGLAIFELRRGRSYLVKASSPGFISAEKKSGVLRASVPLRLQLKAQFASLELPGLPKGAQIFIDDKLCATADQGVVVLNNIDPGPHTLLVRHPEYNDYRADLNNLEAGGVARFLPPILIKVAKLTIQGPAGATVLIDGAMHGKIRSGGTVQIDYELAQAAEHTISVELLDYQPWSKKEMLAPGPRTINITLDPIVTSAGFSDFFANLSLWNAPPSWKIIPDGRNNKLEVGGEQIGALSDKTYRDFRAVFTIWLKDGKGATWAVRIDKEGRNYYLFHLAGPNSTAHTPNRFFTYLVKDGAAPVEVNTPIPLLVDLNQKDPYTIKVEVTGYAVAHYITSEQSGEENTLGAWTDTAATKDKFLYGSFGFRSLSGEVFTVDDLHIEPITKQ